MCLIMWIEDVFDDHMSISDGEPKVDDLLEHLIEQSDTRDPTETGDIEEEHLSVSDEE